MPVLVHKIAALDNGGNPIAGETYQFQDMVGNVPVPSQQKDVIVRPGVDGVTVRQMGVHARPFTLQTLDYPQNFLTAHNALVAYEALIQNDFGIVLTFRSIEYADVFEVLGVQEVDLRAASNVVGAILPAPLCRQVIRWTLIPAQVNPFEEFEE